ncbi:RNA polymerase I associated factor, A49-like protein [Xylariaceae sp. FL0016]|nr:RNA polymerase I associated factor, A49-like protein [Xylariaceae sp. FL0016]
MPEVEAKKRKRGEDGPRPKKKVAVANQPPSTIKVASIQTVRDCPPVIATSPGLCLPSSLKFQAYTKPQSTSKSKRSKHSAQPNNLLLHSSSTNNKLDYTAKEDRESHLKHYIVAVDQASGDVSVIEATKMVVRGHVRSQQVQSSNDTAVKTSMQQRNDLGHAFGTKKAKKALAAITENAIAPQQADTDMATLDSIREGTANMANKEDLQAAADAEKPVPPANLHATEIQGVYTPHRLIGGDILNAIPIKDWQDAVKKKQNLQISGAFVARRVQAIGEGPNPVQRLRVLRYMDFLVRFARAARPGRERGTKRVPPADKLREALEPAPEPVVQSIRRKFSTNGEMRKFHTDLLYTHCCALAAILANYEFETSQIRWDLGLGEKQFAQYFREIGGKVKIVAGAEKGTKVQRAVLALPLEFPQNRQPRARRR